MEPLGALLALVDQAGQSHLVLTLALVLYIEFRLARRVPLVRDGHCRCDCHRIDSDSFPRGR